MKKLIKAFTLIELIVGITISMILMISVGVFVSSGMQNIFIQQKVLENTSHFTDFANNLNTSFNLVQSGSNVEITSSGILFKRGQNFGEGGFSYIGNEALDKVYCLSGSENTITNSAFIKTFIPFEERNSDNTNENIFTNYNDILTSKLIAGGYQSFQKEHVIKSSGNIIIGKGVYGDKFTKGASGKDIYLNSPTGLATDGTNLFISDTLNNRILYYNILGDNIDILLDETDGLNEPTGLYYDDSSLYISNSGNGEILKYSSKSSLSAPTLTMSGFSEYSDKIELSFSSTNTVNLTNTGNITITPAVIINNSILNNPKIEYSFTGNTISEIEINNLLGFSNTGSYYVNLQLFDGVTQKYSNYFPYFTQSDNDLTTPGDNTLIVLYSGLNYPTGIWGSGINDFNEFLESSRIYSNLTYSLTDNLLQTPIKSLEIFKNGTNDLITLFLKYYKSYDCYNLDEKVEKTFLLKKNLK